MKMDAKKKFLEDLKAVCKDNKLPPNCKLVKQINSAKNRGETGYKRYDHEAGGHSKIKLPKVSVLNTAWHIFYF